MPEKTSTTQFSNERILLALAFGLALALRLLRLGEMPLSDEEAGWALQALDVSQGLRPEIGHNPAYVLLTALAFFFFQASDFTARLIPALAGSLLVLAPLFFTDQLGRRAAVVLAFLLAVEPGLLALSRQAGGLMLALTTAVFALGFWKAGRREWAGALTGLALLSGPFLWAGLLIGLLAVLLSNLVQGRSFRIRTDRESWQPFGIALVATYLFLGSLFLFAPGGLGAGLLALPSYLVGWVSFSDVSMMTLLAALPAYAMLALVFGLIGMVRGLLVQDKVVTAVSIFLLSALVVTLGYPSRQVGDLAWVLLPLWALAAIEIEKYIRPAQDGFWETMGMFALSTAMLFFAGLNFMTIANIPLDDTSLTLRWLAFFGAIALLLISAVLVAGGWSIQIAVQGTAWGFLVVLLVYTLAVGTGAAQLRTHTTVSMWPRGPQVVQPRLLEQHLGELARWKVGVPGGLDVRMVAVNSPAMRWALRDWDVTESSAPSTDSSPAFVITPVNYPTLELEAGYRGTDLVWRRYASWEAALPIDWLRWFALRELPQVDEQVILWVRTDIFVDSQNNPQDTQ